jgi:hypothetical protein
LYNDQKKDFFRFLKKNEDAQIQINWGSNEKDPLFPILSLLSCNGSSDKCTLLDEFYPLQHMDVYSVERNPENCSQEEKESEIISKSCAAYMQDQWHNKIAADKHGDYFFTNTSNDGDRIKYHTFNKSITTAIIDNLPDNLEHIKIEKSYFTLHVAAFGEDKDKDTVAKMIIHVNVYSEDSNESDADNRTNTSYYEFAKPCPSYCPDNSINSEQ